MKVFVDTAAFYALLDNSDRNQVAAAGALATAFSNRHDLVTSSYVSVESVALIQRRLGMKALIVFQRDLLPAVATEWVTPEDHKASMLALLTARRRKLSLVDCTSFHLMRRLEIDTAFTFDRHFAEQGFDVVP